jgi:hypothetical protein
MVCFALPLIAAAAALIANSEATNARIRRDFQYLDGGGVGHEIPLKDKTRRALAYRYVEWPSWLLPEINRLKESREVSELPSQIVLLRENNRPAFLALNWRDREDGRIVEIFRIKRGLENEIELEWVWARGDRFANIVEPTGRDVFGDGSSAIFVVTGSGGSGYSGYRLYAINGHPER